jgi:hypothetical protein
MFLPLNQIKRVPYFMHDMQLRFHGTLEQTWAIDYTLPKIIIIIIIIYIGSACYLVPSPNSPAQIIIKLN